MKKIFTFLMIAFSFKATVLNGQIPNNGFEILNTDGSVSNWGNVYLFTFGDSILFDNYFYAPSNDANSGNNAIELRNAWNFTSGHGLAGSISSDTDTVYSAWGSFELVPLLYQPVTFSFFYKYFPANGDTAMASLGLYDSNGDQMGEAIIKLSGTTGNYTLASIPVTYINTGTVAYYSLNFSTFYTDIPGYKEPSYGTRLLIDDVDFGFSTGLKDDQAQRTFATYPNPAAEQINLSGVSPDDFATELWTLTGIKVGQFGSEKQIDVREFPSGVYFLKMIRGRETFMKKVIIQQP